MFNAQYVTNLIQKRFFRADSALSSLHFAEKAGAIASLIEQHNIQGRTFALQEKVKRKQIKVHSATEELFLIADNLGSIVYPYTPCSKGCSYCCEGFVPVFIFEIVQIAQGIGVQRAKKIVQENMHTDHCPFLDGKMCTAYAHRPYVCRTYFSLTSSCRDCTPEPSPKPFSPSLLNLTYQSIYTELLSGPPALTSMRNAADIVLSLP